MSQTTMQAELTLALTFRDQFLSAISPKTTAISLYAAIEPELLKLLYAKNKDLADIAYQKIIAFLTLHLDHTDPDFQTLTTTLKQLLQDRSQYLTSPSRNIWSYWREEGWTGANLALLIFPLLGGAAFAAAGVALLIYTVIITVAAAIDLTRKSPDYWLEEQRPAARELSDQQVAMLKQQFNDIDLFLPQQQPQTDDFKPATRQSYAIYALIFVIGVIGLASLLFPPIGIPVVVLLVLSVVAIVATGAQFELLRQQQQHTLTEIQQEHDKPYDLMPLQHTAHPDSTAVITNTLPKKRIPAPQTSKPLQETATPKPASRPVKNVSNKASDREGEGEQGPHL